MGSFFRYLKTQARADQLRGKVKQERNNYYRKQFKQLGLGREKTDKFLRKKGLW